MNTRCGPGPYQGDPTFERVNKLAPLHSSVRQDWCTPLALFEKYDRIWDFDLDAAAEFHNTLCNSFLGPPGTLVGSTVVGGVRRSCVGADALDVAEWPGGRVWLNPPYGRGLDVWYAKVHEQVTEVDPGGAMVVVMLVPARTDTSYWHEFVIDELSLPRPWIRSIEYLPGRVKFRGAKHGAPFPSAVITWAMPQDWGGPSLRVVS